jgi:hypothetical protein
VGMTSDTEKRPVEALRGVGLNYHPIRTEATNVPMPKMGEVGFYAGNW